MKQQYLIALLSAALYGSPVIAQETGMPPVKTAVIGTQRVGDMLVQSTVTPTWYVPSGVAVAVPGSAPNLTPPPSRAIAQPQPQAQSPAPSPVAQPVTQMAIQPVARDEAEKRKTSTDWKQKIDSIAGDLESKKLALVDAQAQLVVAAEEEKRQADEQVAAAQRRLEASRKQAERAAAYAATLQPSAQPPVAKPTAPVVAPVVVPVPSPVFTLRRQDRTIPAALTRWSEEAGYTLLWETQEDPASFEGTYNKSFADAVGEVVRDLRLAGRDLRMCEYTNKVVRIIPRSAPCQINPSTENMPI